MPNVTVRVAKVFFHNNRSARTTSCFPWLTSFFIHWIHYTALVYDYAYSFCKRMMAYHGFELRLATDQVWLSRNGSPEVRRSANAAVSRLVIWIGFLHFFWFIFNSIDAIVVDDKSYIIIICFHLSSLVNWSINICFELYLINYA